MTHRGTHIDAPIPARTVDAVRNPLPLTLAGIGLSLFALVFALLTSGCDVEADAGDLDAPGIHRDESLYALEHCAGEALGEGFAREARCVDAGCRVDASACIEIALYDRARCLEAIDCSHLGALERCLGGCESEAGPCLEAAGEDGAAIGACYNARYACALACPYADAACPE